jgi:hypothetical protein
MKNNNRSVRYWAGLPMLSLLFFWLSSCQKNLLDKNPLDQLSTATFWKTEGDAMLALTGVYNTGASYADGPMYDLWKSDTYIRLFDLTTDNGYEKDNMVGDLNNGNRTATYSPVEVLWQSSYQKIARCNNFLENIDAVTMDEAEKAGMKAEVRTIRAFDYFYLAFYWGDVPLVEKVLSINEANTVSRTPRQQVMDFVEAELKDAAAALPQSYPAAQKGRITKGAALAILGRVQMAQQQWADAVESYRQIIDMGQYIIDPNYKQLFEEAGENSAEIILSSQRMDNVYGTLDQRSCLPFMYGGYHQFNVYNELVESYECTDGKPITESPLFDPDHPYKNRDPRLYASVFIPEYTVFRGQLYVAHPDSINAKDRLPLRAWSGYAVKKFVDEGYKGSITSYGGDFPMIRYAEVLLSYLEANIEAGNPVTQQLLDQTINLVRGRTSVNMPPVTETDPDKLRPLVRNERRVELALEGLRLYDLFRWHIAHINLEGNMHGMKLTTDPEHYTAFPIDADGYFVCRQLSFREQTDYLFPIPQSERDVNANLTQNPGY